MVRVVRIRLSMARVVEVDGRMKAMVTVRYGPSYRAMINSRSMLSNAFELSVYIVYPDDIYKTLHPQSLITDPISHICPVPPLPFHDCVGNGRNPMTFSPLQSSNIAQGVGRASAHCAPRGLCTSNMLQ